MMFPPGSNNSIIPVFDAKLRSSIDCFRGQGQLFLPAGKFYLSSKYPHIITFHSLGILTNVNPRGAPFFLTTSEPLSEIFAEEWNGLPVELKRHILSFLLVKNQPISYRGPTGLEHWLPLDSSFGHLYKLLHTTSEIATLSREMFYQENTFAIGLHRSCIYPHAAHQLIKKLFLIVHHTNCVWYGMTGCMIPGPNNSVLKALQKLSCGSFGLNNLQRVDIEFDTDYMEFVGSSWRLDEPIDIPYEGSSQLLVDNSFLLSGSMGQRLRSNLEGLFTFKGQKQHTRVLQK
jgi:hypothetical protein